MAAAILAGLLATSVAAVGAQAAVAAEAPPATAASAGYRYDDLPDPDPSSASFSLQTKWNKTTLTYFFASGTLDIAGTTTERGAMRDAMALWSNVSPLTFTEVASYGAADIVIRFVSGDHGDGNDFDGAGGALAHAFFPPPLGGSFPGDAHLDDAETWTANLTTSSAQPIDLLTVFAHEIGHSIGLGHSAVSTALMAPYYSMSHRWLDPDDVAGVQALYGMSPGAQGFVVANRPTSSSYAPSTDYSYNSSGGANTLTRSGIGVYQARMANLGATSGSVQVAAVGHNSHHCKVANWGPSGTTQTINVRCFTGAGAPIDTMYAVSYARFGPASPVQGAYVWANNPTSADYTPSANYSFNSTGATNTISRSGRGAYTVSMPGFDRVGGNVQVTAYGNSSNHCKASSWGISTADVRCFTTAGSPVDTHFVLSYVRNHVPNGGRQGAYAWANGTAPSYTPSSTYQWHSKSSNLTVTRWATGVYMVTVPGMKASNDTSVGVTASGSGSEYCNIGDAVQVGADTVITVGCYNASGTAYADSQFTVRHLTSGF